MAGTDPAVLLILDDVELRMRNMTTGNGYWYTTKKFERATREPWKDYDLPALNYWGTQVINTRPAYENHNRELRLFIEQYAVTRDDPFIDIAEKMASDIVTALTRLPVATAGRSVGQDGAYTDMSAESLTKFKISADGDAAEEVTCVWAGAVTGALVAAQMQTQIQALVGNKAAVTVSFARGRYTVTSGSTGASSAIEITAGGSLDCAPLLRLGGDNSGLEYVGLAAAPMVSDAPNFDLHDSVEDITYDGHEYLIGEGQEPWTGVLVKFGIEYFTDPFDMFNYYRE